MRRLAAAGGIVAALAGGVAGCGGKTRSADSVSVSVDSLAASGDTLATAPLSNEGDTSSRATPAPPSRDKSSGPPATGGAGVTASVRPTDGADTLRGIVSVVGASIDAHPVLKPNGGGATVALTGPQAAALARTSGTEVWVSGTRTGPRAMAVDRFLVRSVNGFPAFDGTLTARDGNFALVTTADHSELPIVNPPSALRSRVGARVWVTGPLETGAVTFGVISDR